MAPNLPSLDIINPQYPHGFLLEQNIPEISNIYYEVPSQNLSFQPIDCQSIGSSDIIFNQINQILLPGYHSSHEKTNECNIWVNTLDQNYYHINQSGNNSVTADIGGSTYDVDSQSALSYPITSHIDYVQESLKQERVSQKRNFEGEEMQMSKKKCGTNRKTEPMATSPSKDTQSLAAKNRRERISERLKVLQELVPNGTKVDMVTMLEKAISYVKFLQLQVKVLATDEFWPAQGGTAPDISQVKEAIDAILSFANEAASKQDKDKNQVEK